MENKGICWWCLNNVIDPSFYTVLADGTPMHGECVFEFKNAKPATKESHIKKWDKYKLNRYKKERRTTNS